MRKLSLFVISLALFSCVTNVDKKKMATDKEDPKVSVLQKIADAHGFDHWKDIASLKFTFNVERDTTHFERTWIWDTRKNWVTAISGTDTVTYNRKDMDSVAQKINAGFINDKYWLMMPYNLVWDQKAFQYTYKEKAVAPISHDTLQEVTIVYGNQGGYTPGDAYDLFFGDDYLLKEWNYRKGNQPEPSMSTTWQDYTTSNGLKIAQVHQNEDGSFKLHFTHLETQTD